MPTDPARQVQALLEQLKARPAPEKQAEILVALGDLQAAPLEASLYYVKAVSATPQRPQIALARLARLARQTGEARVADALVEGLSVAGRFEDVETVLRRQAEAAADAPARARALIAAARVAELHLNDGDLARAHLQAASADTATLQAHLFDFFSAHPDDFGGVRALSRALATFDPEGAVALLTKAAEDAGPARAQLRFAAGRIAVKQLKAPLQALSHFFEVLSMDRGYLDRALPLIDEILSTWGDQPDVAESLLALFERLGQTERVGAVLRVRLEASAGAARAAARLALAEHAEYQRLDPEAAFEQYRLGLEEGEGDLGAFAAGMRRVGAEGVEGAFTLMSGLFERLGLWRALVNVLDDEAALQVDDPARAKLCWRAGVILETRLDDLQGAMNRYIQAFRLEPKSTRYIEAGERLYRLREDWRMVARLLKMRLELTKGAQARQALLLDWAALCAERLDDPISAYQALRAARDEGRDVDAPLRQLLGAPEVMSKVYAYLEAEAQAAPPEAARKLWLDLAALCLELGDDPSAGLAALRQASALAPEDERLFERVAAALSERGALQEAAAHLA
ncbi:hypothetical protein KJ940_01570, partial [Myxococcota bacterium]|nr:hypothetical protein [Myxococcota bacterium]